MKFVGGHSSLIKIENISFAFIDGSVNEMLDQDAMAVF